MLKTMLLRPTLLGLMLLTGCALEPRVVLVPPILYHEGKPTDLLKAGPGISGRMYVYNGTTWELSANKLEVPEGWLVMPPPPHNDAR